MKEARFDAYLSCSVEIVSGLTWIADFMHMYVTLLPSCGNYAFLSYKIRLTVLLRIYRILCNSAFAGRNFRRLFDEFLDSEGLKSHYSCVFVVLPEFFRVRFFVKK